MQKKKQPSQAAEWMVNPRGDVHMSGEHYIGSVLRGYDSRRHHCRYVDGGEHPRSPQIAAARPETDDFLYINSDYSLYILVSYVFIMPAPNSRVFLLVS